MADEDSVVPVEGETKHINLGDVPHVRDADYVSRYVNYAQGGHTPWDISITFGVLDEAEGRTVIVDRATLTFSPPLARAVIAVIQANIRGYEELFGEIVMPKGFGGAGKKVKTRQRGESGEAAETGEKKPE